MMQTAMVCIPRKGKSKEEIQKIIFDASSYLTGREIPYFLSSYAEDQEHALSVFSTTIVIMGIYCNAAYFPKDWHDDPICRILHDIAAEYDLDIIYE